MEGHLHALPNQQGNCSSPAAVRAQRRRLVPSGSTASVIMVASVSAWPRQISVNKVLSEVGRLCETSSGWTGTASASFCSWRLFEAKHEPANTAAPSSSHKPADC